jgi:DNA-binding Lrp family transcriptional regulator
MVDEIDQKLILALQQDGRATITELSQLSGLHVSTVSKRVDQLIEGGTIRIKALPNPFKLGYSALAFTAIEAENRKIDSICARLCADFNVNMVVTAFGRYNILATVYFPAWEQLLDFVSTTLPSLDGVLNVEPFLVKEVRKRYPSTFMEDPFPAKIDETDIRMVAKLAENGRLTSRSLAEELDISLPTCTRRLSHLLKEKVIDIRAVPNMSKFGYPASAFLLLRAQTSELESICSILQEHKDVFMLMTLSNKYDILVGLIAPSLEELHLFIRNRIFSLDGVLGDETIIRAEIKKRYYGGFLDGGSGPVV